MQLVTRKQLFDLAGTSRLGEAEQSDFDYDEFKNIWKKTYIKFRKSNPIELQDRLIHMTYEHMSDSLNGEKDVKYVGCGSSRIAFALVGGKCLKIARYNSGIAQNKQEIENYNAIPNLKCFTQIYDFDKQTYSSLLSECCAEAKYDDFEKLYELSLEDMCDQLTTLKNDFKNSKNLQSLIKKFIDNNEDNEAMQKFWENCLSNKAPQWDVMRDLLKFYKKDVTKLEAQDLVISKNWGLAIRDGKVVLVILDYGMSDDVINKYYT